jgi:hypothetical protein
MDPGVALGGRGLRVFEPWTVDNITGPVAFRGNPLPVGFSAFFGGHCLNLLVGFKHCFELSAGGLRGGFEGVFSLDF